MFVAAGWGLVVAGFLTGAGMGLLAQREDWLGGYNSRPRRLVRLGHIALVALGALNVVWPLTTTAQIPSSMTPVISGLFLVGGLTMGPACFLTAFVWRARAVFLIPSTALIVGAILATGVSLL